MPEGLPFHFKDYLELVDWTGRIIRDDKRGAIPTALPPILERLDIEPKQWLFLATKFESRFKSLVGCTYKLKQAAEKLGYKRTPGLSMCKALLSKTKSTLSNAMLLPAGIAAAAERQPWRLNRPSPVASL